MDTVKRDGKANWTGKVSFDENLLSQPLKWRKPAKIFVNSMSDLFYEAVPDKFIQQAFATMLKTDWHEFQILTKRPKRAREFLMKYNYQLPIHIWIGVSIEKQRLY